MKKKLVSDVDLRDKRVLLRVDFNVPLSNGIVADDTRIRAALPTIDYLVNQEAALIIISHLGRPKGMVKPEFSLEPVVKHLSTLTDVPVKFVSSTVGDEAEAQVKALKKGEILVLENLRFDPREKQNDREFAAVMASYADVYVNDAFGVSHRAHASVAALPELMGEDAVAGFLLEKEINYASKVLDNPARPFTAILGGKKVSDKIKVIEALLDQVDNLVIGGGMANTFLKASGYQVGISFVEEDKLSLAAALMEKAQKKDVGLYLPVDVVTAKAFSENAEPHYYSIDAIPANEMILDIGPATCEYFATVLKGSKLVVWNGPMGVFEMKPFSDGTRTLAAYLSVCDADIVVGGGDSAAAVTQFGYAQEMSHISTGGGAFLELMEGKELPGLTVLADGVEK